MYSSGNSQNIIFDKERTFNFLFRKEFAEIFYNWQIKCLVLHLMYIFEVSVKYVLYISTH